MDYEIGNYILKYYYNDNDTGIYYDELKEYRKQILYNGVRREEKKYQITM